MKRSLEQTNLEQLHTDGYVHIKKAIKISNDIHDECITQSNKKSSAIFNHNELMSKNDKKRKQTNLSTKKQNMKNFIKNTNEYLKTNINSKLDINNWVIIKSLPNCHGQAAHCDYAQVGNIMNVQNDLMPLSVIIALQPDTKLDVWPKSIRNSKIKMPKQINKLTLNINTGDMIVFRGDLVHAGSEYDKENYRLHAFMDSSKVPRTNNRTWLIARHADGEMKKRIII